MTSCWLFTNMNVNSNQSSFDEVLNVGFDLGHFKMNTYSIKSQICKGLSKGFI